MARSWSPRSDKKDRVLDREPEETENYGLSSLGCQALKNLLRELSDNIKPSLYAGDLAGIGPLKLQLKPDATAVRGKQRDNVLHRRELMTRNVQELLKLTFLKKVS